MNDSSPNDLAPILSQLVEVLREFRQPASPPAELLSAKQAANMTGLSVASWWRRHAAGEVPAAVQLGGKTLWRRVELLSWVNAGCPSRKAWEALKSSR